LMDFEMPTMNGIDVRIFPHLNHLGY
jgi:hypothetical protein